MHVQGNCLLETNLEHFPLICITAGIVGIVFLKSRVVYQAVKNILVGAAPEFLALRSCWVLSLQNGDCEVAVLDFYCYSCLACNHKEC